MWTRAELKERAKDVLRGSYWKAFFVSLILLFVGGGSNGGSSSRFSSDSSGLGINADLLWTILLIVFLIGIVFLILRIIIGFTLEVGCQKYFIQSTDSDVNLNHVMFGFKKGRYGNLVLGMLYRSVLLFLWTLLLIIPGIIKSYAYRFVPYLLADNPDMKPSRAIELSNQMTNGHKFDMFVLDLSFIGWYILGGLALGVGILFVNPYKDSTYAQLYVTLRDNIIKSGKTSYSELNLAGVVEVQEEDTWESVFDREDY